MRNWNKNKHYTSPESSHTVADKRVQVSNYFTPNVVGGLVQVMKTGEFTISYLQEETIWVNFT